MKLIAAFVALTCVACVVEPEPRKDSQAGLCSVGRIHVHRASSSLDPSYLEGLRLAARAWSEALGSSQEIIVSDEANLEGDPCVTVWRESASLDASTFGLTEGGQVTLTTQPLPTAIKRQLPVHEMGHTLGLGDARVKDSVMWKFIGPGQSITPQDACDVRRVNGLPPC